MNKIVISKLTLTNFKGIESFNLDTQGKEIEVLGRNASGKTTIFDAFTWLLFGKDSSYKSDFSIKTLDESGKVKQNGINHEVEAVFSIDEKVLTLKRTYAEVWTKKQGESEKKFTGHTTTYFVDEEPVLKKAYDEKINSIISEETFKLLTSPEYFNEILDWTGRRKALMEIGGDISEEEIVSGDKDLKDFLEALDGKTIESFTNILKSKRKLLNKEIEGIPIRIDEVSKNVKSLGGNEIDDSSVKEKGNKLNADIKKANEELNGIRNGSELNEKKILSSDLRLRMTEFTNAYGKEERENKHKTEAKLQEVNSNISLLKRTIEEKQTTIKNNKLFIKRSELQLEEMRNVWQTTNNKTLEINEHDENCPACKQSIPAEQIKEANEKAIADFNLKKSKQLEYMVEDAGIKKDSIDDAIKTSEKTEKEIEKTQKEIDSLKAKEVGLKKELEAFKTDDLSGEDSKEYKTMQNELKTLEGDISSVQNDLDVVIKGKETEIAEMEEERHKLRELLESHEYAKAQKTRIAELEHEERELGNQLNAIDKNLYLAGRYTKARVNLLEKKLNSHFKHARFKLFEEQLNGGLREVCETLYKGVPYSSGLNNASRINVGLDIINTLSKHYNISVPIFIDNAEGVIDVLETDAQRILLTVKDCDLKVNQRGNENDK